MNICNIYCSILRSLAGSTQLRPAVTHEELGHWQNNSNNKNEHLNNEECQNLSTESSHLEMCNGLDLVMVNPLLSANVPPAKSGGPRGAGGFSNPV